MQTLRMLGPERVDEAFEAPLFLLFKHSPSCPISARAFYELRTFLETGPDVPVGWIHVIEERPLSQEVARRTGVRHESPQALLLAGGRVLWSDSHGGITSERLGAALSAARPEAQSGS